MAKKKGTTIRITKNSITVNGPGANEFFRNFVKASEQVAAEKKANQEKKP